jgi:hypothetical protein
MVIIIIRICLYITVDVVIQFSLSQLETENKFHHQTKWDASRSLELDLSPFSLQHSQIEHLDKQWLVREQLQ